MHHPLPTGSVNVPPRMCSVTETLRSAVENSGMSLNQLQYATSIPRQVLSLFVKEGRYLNGRTIDKLACYFGLTLQPVALHGRTGRKGGRHAPAPH